MPSGNSFTMNGFSSPFTWKVLMLLFTLWLFAIRSILCPVALVVDLHEPPVVPDFLDELGSMGWFAVRANAYDTRWAGAKCTERLLKVEYLDGIVFTSTAEVEGLLKSLRDYGLGWEDVRKRWARLVVAVPGPVTASAAESLGVKVEVVSSNFSSFDGMVYVVPT